MRKLKIIAVFGIFIISFISHFLYQIIPLPIISFFFPVNESIFEHMKIIYTSTLLYGIIDYFLLKKEKIDFSNFPLQLFLTSFLGIILYLIMYLPFRYFFGEHLIVSIILLFVVYSIMQLLSYYILRMRSFTFLNYVAIILLVIVYIFFIYYTYHPIHNMFFYDTSQNGYGIIPPSN